MAYLFLYNVIFFIIKQVQVWGLLVCDIVNLCSFVLISFSVNG
jgi:hypothetical protein